MFSSTTIVSLLAIASAVSAMPSWTAGPEAKAVLMDRRTGKPATDVEFLKRQDDVPDITEFLKSRVSKQPPFSCMNLPFSRETSR